MGGGAAGATAAQFARKENRSAEIHIFEASTHPEYSRCGLPYALSGEIPSFESLIEYSEEWFQRNKINLHLSTKVVDINASQKTLAFEGAEGDEKAGYDSLIFTTGASPSIPKIEGVSAGDRLRKGVFLFRGMDDAKALGEWCESRARKVLIVGAGLVGLECAEALHKLGHQITVVEYLESVLPMMIDPDMADPLLSEMIKAGIEIKTFAAVESVFGGKDVEGVRIRNRKDDHSEELSCDTVVLTTGQRPLTSLALAAGCALGRHGHIKVDNRCETNVPGIFAAGDCSEYKDMITKRELPVGMGSLAVKMGEIAGRNAVGGDVRLLAGFLNSRVTKLFGIEIAAVGPLSTELSAAEIKYIQSRVKGSTLPAYYPGGKNLLMKLTASREDVRLLSCQIMGKEGCGHRANVIGALILAGRSAQDLAMLETTYAPPVAPCVDVITTAAQAILIKSRRAGLSG